ncbi:unnamed protein product [Paramecium octaurelia]|uniref:Uncharacterized protein n=1 Tax=Paramecium octaurelia TaxID=43137 RepID=A0A8S1TLH7_PAROT|nr:unnamed protein product [Paramecium octaurelia]
MLLLSEKIQLSSCDYSSTSITHYYKDNIHFLDNPCIILHLINKFTHPFYDLNANEMVNLKFHPLFAHQIMNYSIRFRLI